MKYTNEPKPIQVNINIEKIAESKPPEGMYKIPNIYINPSTNNLIIEYNDGISTKQIKIPVKIGV